MASILHALDCAQAVAEIGLDGRIVSANANFLAMMGHRQDEIVGRYHSIFFNPATMASQAYQKFW